MRALLYETPVFPRPFGPLSALRRTSDAEELRAETSLLRLPKRAGRRTCRSPKPKPRRRPSPDDLRPSFKTLLSALRRCLINTFYAGWKMRFSWSRLFRSSVAISTSVSAVTYGNKSGGRAIRHNAGPLIPKPASPGRRRKFREIDAHGGDQRARQRRASEARPKQGADRCRRTGEVPAGARTVEHRAIATPGSDGELSAIARDRSIPKPASAARRNRKPHFGGAKQLQPAVQAYNTALGTFSNQLLTRCWISAAPYLPRSQCR